MNINIDDLRLMLIKEIADCLDMKKMVDIQNHQFRDTMMLDYDGFGRIATISSINGNFIVDKVSP